MDHSTRRAPLRKGRRIPLNVTLSPDIHRDLAKLEKGNRSAAIEMLVREYFERARAVNFRT
jgi:hypothetical protein